MVEIKLSAEELKMIFLDMDGTLLNEDSIVSAGNEAVLKELFHKGYKIVIATGRNYYEARKLTEKIPGLDYITTNGSSIYDRNGEIIFSKPLQEQTTKIILKIMEQISNLTYSLFTNKEILVKSKVKHLNLMYSFFSKQWKKEEEAQSINMMKEKLIKRMETSLKEIVNLNQYIESNQLEIEKIFAVGDKESLISLKESITFILGNNVKLSSSGKNNLEINSADVSKGKAAVLLAEKYNIPLKETMAFGDSQNDLELFDVVGLSVAMGNSSDLILKEKADIITLDNDQDGVAQVLNNLLLNDT